MKKWIKSNFGFFSRDKVRPFAPFLQVEFERYITGHKAILLYVGNRFYTFIYKL